MILIFSEVLGPDRRLLSVPLSMVFCLWLPTSWRSINTMILAVWHCVFRLIDNGVIVLENIFVTWRWRAPMSCGARGTESRWRYSLHVHHSIVFFPVTFFNGISNIIFTPLALGVVLSIFASYFFAMTVVPLYCAKFIRIHTKTESARKRRVSLRKVRTNFSTRNTKEC